MQFGGHETFPLREGWLHKGLELVRDDARAFEDEEGAPLADDEAVAIAIEGAGCPRRIVVTA